MPVLLKVNKVPLVPEIVLKSLARTEAGHVIVYLILGTAILSLTLACVPEVEAKLVNARITLPARVIVW